MQEDRAASYVTKAILSSGDMCFKMPVLNAAFADTPAWERRIQRLIRQERWPFAKVHFIHFYWRHVTNRNRAFMAEMIEYVRSYKRTDDTLGIVDEMLESLDNG